MTICHHHGLQMADNFALETLVVMEAIVAEACCVWTETNIIFHSSLNYIYAAT